MSDFYNNDDIMQEIDELHGKVDNMNEQLGLMMKFMEGLQAQLGNEVDSLAKLTKLENANFKESIDILNKLKVKVN
tara:strand:+ start:362 stop:589 length:228 start_codon:yes stop_codon:yes gene_type:complete